MLRAGLRKSKKAPRRGGLEARTDGSIDHPATRDVACGILEGAQEAFLRLFGSRLVPGGLFLLDEPEAALSPARQLQFLVLLHEYVQAGSQFIIATHSPIIMAYPNASILAAGREDLKAEKRRRFVALPYVWPSSWPVDSQSLGTRADVGSSANTARTCGGPSTAATSIPRLRPYRT